MAKAKQQTTRADRPNVTEQDLPTPILPVLVETVGGAQCPKYSTFKALKEYAVEDHDVFDQSIDKRPKKKVKKPMIGPNGKQMVDVNGKPMVTEKYQEVNRIGLPFQKLIVKRRVGFMNVRNMSLEASPKTDDEQRLFDMVKKVRDDNKMDFVEKEVATRMLTELQVAKLWYTQEVDPSYWNGLVRRGGTKRMRCEILSPVKGDQLLPVFNDYGDLIYFGRAYEASIGYEMLLTRPDLLTAYGTKIKRLDIYSATHIYKFRQSYPGETIISTPGNNGWVIDDIITHSYGKIPVIYYSKPAPPWADVQSAISRLETVLSNFADTNDYHGSPTLAFIGQVTGELAEKGESGKAVQIKPAAGTTLADVKYVTWEHAPESIKLEVDTLVKFAFTCTQTPQMAMEDMKDLGNVSGVAYDRIFSDAIIAAQDELDGEYGMRTQQDLNLIKAICASIDTSLPAAARTLSISAAFTVFKIDDDKDTIGNIAAAINAGILSRETAVEFFPWIKDKEEELARLLKEKNEAMEQAATQPTPSQPAPLAKVE